MAFDVNEWQPQVSARGGAAMSYYANEADSTAEIKAPNYFKHNEVSSFILQQSKDAASDGIPVMCRSSTDLFIIELLLDKDGNVNIKTGAGFEIT